MESVEERFRKSIIEHQMIRIHEAGLVRHLTFKSPKTYKYHFHITTWPGYLAISGDVGCYVFARLPDMFNFFRGNRINPDYWSEKLQSSDRDGVTEFSVQLFREAIKNDFDGWPFDDEGQKAQAWAALQETNYLGEDGNPESVEHAVREAMDYKCPVTENTFQDFWEHDLRDYTFRFLWCCHAIQWAVFEHDRRNPMFGRVQAAE